MSTLVEWTMILNQGATTAAAALPAIPAGSNRVLLVGIMPYHGSANAENAASITINGITRAQFAGDFVPRERIAFGWYAFLESEIATISGQSISSTVVGTSKTVIYKVLENIQQLIPVNVTNNFATVNGTINTSLVRAADSHTEGIAATATTGTTLTLTNPGGDGVLATSTDRRITFGNQSEISAGTSDFSVVGNARTTISAVNFARPTSAPTISSVNGGAGIRAGGVISAELSNFSNPPNSGVFATKSLVGLDGSASVSTSVMPMYVDGQAYPDPEGDYTLTLNAAGGQTANKTEELLPPDGYAIVEFGALVTGNDRYLAAHLPIASGQKFVYPTEGGEFEVYSDGRVRASTLGTRECWRWDDQTGVMHNTFVTADQAGITDGWAISAKPITAHFISSSLIAAMVH